MCGYCTEHYAFLAMQYSRKPDQNFFDLHLQGVRNLATVLQQLETDTVFKPSIALVIKCRAIELLTLQGYESAAYQELLQQTQFMSAIAASCPKYECDPYTDPITAPFKWLSNINIYLKHDCFKQHVDKLDDQSCRALFEKYIGWWLSGGMVKRVDLLKVMGETGILDPLDDISGADRLLLERRFPALWFALLRVFNRPDCKEILWTIIIRNPEGVPEFCGLDLWLQRRAVFAYYDLYGFTRFMDEIKSVRFELLQCIAATKPLTGEEKLALIAALKGRADSSGGTVGNWDWASDLDQ